MSHTPHPGDAHRHLAAEVPAPAPRDPSVAAGAGAPPVDRAARTNPPVAVLSTTPDGTRAALLAARHAGHTRAVLFVPRAAMSPTSMADTVEDYRALAHEAGVTVSVHVCICRRPDDIAQLLGAGDATVVLGGARRRWWPTRAQRLARRLAKHGHRVVFADVRADTESGEDHTI